jgi:hypothetical protein
MKVYDDIELVISPVEYAQLETALTPEVAKRRAVAHARAARLDTFTRLLSCKPLDVEMSRLQRAALRRLKNKGKR